MVVVLYGLLLAHLNAYRNQYMNIFTTFSISFLLKRLVKSAGQKEHSELIGLAGYSLTIGEFAKLLGEMKRAGSKVIESEDANKIVGGLLGKGVDSLMELFKK